MGRQKSCKVIWTADINEHPWVQKTEIYLYWPSTCLFQQPRQALKALAIESCWHLNSSPESLRVEKLRRAHGIIFATISPALKNDRAKVRQEEVFRHKLDERKFMYDDWNTPPSLNPESININLRSLDKLLSCYKSCPAPP